MLQVTLGTCPFKVNLGTTLIIPTFLCSAYEGRIASHKSFPKMTWAPCRRAEEFTRLTTLASQTVLNGHALASQGGADQGSSMMHRDAPWAADGAQAWRMGVLRERRVVQAPGAQGAGMQAGAFSCSPSPYLPSLRLGCQLSAQLGLHVCVLLEGGSCDLRAPRSPALPVPTRPGGTASKYNRVMRGDGRVMRGDGPAWPALPQVPLRSPSGKEGLRQEERL